MSPHPRRGFSFVEIAVATLFLALAMVPLVDSIMRGQQRVAADRRRTFATALAASTLERFRLESPATVAGALASAADHEVLNPMDAPPSWRQLRDQFDVSATFDGASPGALTVTVTWNEGPHERRIQLATVLAPTFAPTGGP